MIISGFVDEKHRKKERERAKALRKSQWWRQKLTAGECYYCQKVFPREALTMDHKTPVARGGTSTKGNVVVACKDCNSNKKSYTPAEMILNQWSD
ncbi:MAG: HNH endonuclease [Pseudomonadota bacterium]